MITPLEIEQKEFGKGVRGYKEEEVDQFLNLIILEMENLIKEKKELIAENEKLKKEIENSKTSEGQILETLETARRLMNDISVSAEKRAEVLLKNAELDADLIKREAVETADRLSEESDVLRARISTLREKYRNLLETELERFDVLSSEVFLEADEIVKSLPEAKTVQNEKTDTLIVESVKDLSDLDDNEADTEIDMSKTILNIR